MVRIPSTAALIPAAGFGRRLGLGPKALLQLNSRCLIDILVEKLLPLVDSILISVPDSHLSEFEYLSTDKIQLVRGGNTRQQSIELMLADCDADVLLIQDVARPFASSILLTNVLQAALDGTAAGAFLQSDVPVGKIKNSQVGRYWSQSEAGVFQAPQAFNHKVLLSAIEATKGREFQSTAQMMITAGYPLAAIDGEPENIKITTALDWQIAQKIIAPKLGFC